MIGSVIIKAINIINDDADDATIQVGLGSVSQIMELANDYVLTGGNYDVTGVYDAEGHAYYLNLAAVNYDSINLAVTADDRLNKSYTLKDQGESGGETVTDDLGALVGYSLTVNGKGLFLNGTVNEEKKKGFVLGKDVTTEHNQTLTLKNMTVKNFEVAVTNNEGGTLNVQNVTFTDNTDPSGEMAADILNQGTANISGSTIAGIYNDSVLNLSGNNTITNIYDGPTLDDEAPITGVTNITGESTTIVSGGVVTQNAINMQGGNLRLVSSTVNSDIVGDADFNTTGKLEIASGTINGNITGTFKNNERIIGGAILYNSNSDLTIDNANFLSNAATQIGGAIVAQTTGTNSITNTTFTGNSATSSSDNAYGGAIYQEGGTLTISGSTFGGSEEGQGNTAASTANSKFAYGGAIYHYSNDVLTLSDTIFEKNSVSSTGTYNSSGTPGAHGGAIFKENGTLTIVDTQFKDNSATAADSYTEGGANGGAIYLNNGTYSISGTKSGTGDNVTSTTIFENNKVINTGGASVSWNGQGAALYTNNSSGTIDQVVFKNNDANNGSETAKGLKLNVNEISDVHKQDGEGHYIYDTNYDALQVLNQHEGTRTLTADGAAATTYTVGDNLGTTAVYQ